jgi:hypothetical protein
VLLTITSLLDIVTDAPKFVLLNEMVVDVIHYLILVLAILEGTRV